MVVGGEETSAGRPSTAARTATAAKPRGKRKPNRAAVVAQTMLASGRQWCGSKGAYNRPSYPCHYCTYRGGLLRQGAVDKAKSDDRPHAGERQHHHLKVRKAVVGKQRKIVHDMRPKDVYPQKRTSSDTAGMSALCHEPTYAVQQICSLLDHLAGAAGERHVQAARPTLNRLTFLRP